MDKDQRNRRGHCLKTQLFIESLQNQLMALDFETVDEKTLEDFLRRMKAGALHRLYSFYEDERPKTV